MKETDHSSLGKRELILQSADELLDTLSFHQIKIKDITENIQIGKGSVYLYFQSKEEVFLSLFERYLHTWLEEINQGLKSSKSDEELIKELANDLTNKKKLLKLWSILYSFLEGNISHNAAAAFKFSTLTKLQKVGRVLEERFTNLKPGEGAKFFLTLNAFITGISQAAFPAQQIDELYSSHSEFEFYRMDFNQEIKKFLFMFFK